MSMFNSAISYFWPSSSSTTWFFSGNNNGWYEYEPRIQQELEAEMTAKAKNYYFQINNEYYEVDFATMRQTRLSDPSKKRKVKREKSKSPANPAASWLASPMALRRSSNDLPPLVSSTPRVVFSLPAAALTRSPSAPMIDTPLNAKWFYWGDNYTWNEYEPRIQQELEAKIKAKARNHRFQIYNELYEVDFSSMLQTRVRDPSKRRKVMREKSKAKETRSTTLPALPAPPIVHIVVTSPVEPPPLVSSRSRVVFSPPYAASTSSSFAPTMDTPLNVNWFYWGDNNDWQEFQSNLQTEIERRYSNKAEKYTCWYNFEYFDIKFKDMTQTAHKDPRDVRKIKRERNQQIMGTPSSVSGSQFPATGPSPIHHEERMETFSANDIVPRPQRSQSMSRIENYHGNSAYYRQQRKRHVDDVEAERYRHHNIVDLQLGNHQMQQTEAPVRTNAGITSMGGVSISPGDPYSLTGPQMEVITPSHQRANEANWLSQYKNY